MEGKIHTVECITGMFVFNMCSANRYRQFPELGNIYICSTAIHSLDTTGNDSGPNLHHERLSPVSFCNFRLANPRNMMSFSFIRQNY